MKISRAWLSDYLDLTDFSDSDIASRLTLIGHAVEGIEKHGEDSVFEVEFTSNRIDAMSHLGLARELSAALDRPLIRVKLAQAEHESFESAPIRVTITAPELCARFSALPMSGITVRPSSERIRTRLEAVGLRPINNIVDITNYVMLATGHPMHAFDLDRLSGRSIEVRRAGAGESLETLDGVKRTLSGDEVVVADATRGVGLGGVMGGRNSEITAATKNVLLECAWFEPAVIRQVSKKHGIKSDAAYRFERNVDPNDTVATLELAASLIASEGGGRRGDMVDNVAREIPPVSVVLRASSVTEMSGGAVTLEEASELLIALGMRVESSSDESIEVSIPAYRSDIREEIDLIEEALRFHGFDRVPSSLPRVTSGDVRSNPLSELEDELRDILLECGLTETVQYSFIRTDHNSLFSSEPQVAIQNPLSENIESMRLTLFPGLLETATFNRNSGTRDGAIFEIGRTYHQTASGTEERRVAALLFFGTREGSSAQVGFFDVKGVLEAIGARTRSTLSYRPLETDWLAKGQAASAFSGELEVARLGMLARGVRDSFDLRGEAGVCEIDLAALLSARVTLEMKAVPRFPGVPMALGIVHSNTVRYQDLVDAIARLEVPYLHEVGLRDRFIPDDRTDEIKTTLGMWYQSFDRSLTQDEVVTIHRTLGGQLAGMLEVQVLIP
ncbi:MAG TPA: phenylalanine--tRNA ligase subunit beta [Thermoanaerobaculia bacterium]|nr:phenylalanine--tRNA ligase subunit beta [Thermoanaerobaculia bacterium]